MTRFSAILAVGLLAASAALPQTPPPATRLAPGPERTQLQGQSGQGDCPAPATTAAPATRPAPGSDSTEANNSGTSGWSGGLGGSHLGTNTQGALPASPTWQPPTARGLDLKGRAEPVAQPVAPGC